MKVRRLCPSCKSDQITYHMGLQVGMQYFCKKCGYHGPLVIEEEKISKE